MCSSWRPTNSVKVLRHTGIYLLLHPNRGAECGDEYICLCVCVFVCDQIFVQVTSGSGLVLLQQYSDMLYISSFVHDVIFAHKLRLLDVAARFRQ